MNTRSNNTTYTGRSSKGRNIDVFFFHVDGNDKVVRALAISSHLTAIFHRKKDGTWHTYTESLTIEWGPVVEAAYKYLLDDIISGDVSNI